MKLKNSLQNLRFIAFYLPQFHPTPENDRWWGKGFTEWTNVTKAAPLFNGHYQPHLPTDTGFYDLRVKETRLDQIEMAKDCGIDGFCYHYYWFSGTKILNQPVDAMLADSDHDMPFCLCWANENWTRQWDAAEHEILIAQQYAPEDDLNFVKSLIPFFNDPRYIRHEGKPFLIVYRPQHLPDSKKSIEIWRNYCREVGVGDIHVCCALTHGNMDHHHYGFDSGVEFPPHNLAGIDSVVDKRSLEFYGEFTGTVVQFESVAHLFLNREYPGSDVFKAVFPSWDNTARRGLRAFVVLNGNPENYEYWLNETVKRVQEQNPGKERLLFINAWNEWAEGCHLEPDRVYGRKFLEATQRVKLQTSKITSFTDSPPATSQQSFVSSLLAQATGFTPEFVSLECFWNRHLPFLSWVVSVLKPKVMACINIDTGNAVANMARFSKKYASDAQVFGSIRADSSPIVDAISRSKDNRIQFFNSGELEFVQGLGDQSVDLLIFDDFKSFEALPHVFEVALSKVSARGVILMHDIFVKSSPMFEFWDQTKENYPSFTFSQSHGLGVLLIGNEVPVELHRLCDADVSNDAWKTADFLFGLLGDRVELQAAISVAERNNDGAALKLNEQLQELQQRLVAMTNSKSWRLTAPIRKLASSVRS